MLTDGLFNKEVPSPSTSGNVLTSDGNNWVSQAASGSGWNPLARNNITSSTAFSTFDSSVITSAYTKYAVVASDISYGTGSTYLIAQAHSNGAWQTSSGDWQFNVRYYNQAHSGNEEKAYSGDIWNQSNLKIFPSTSGSNASLLTGNFTLYFETKAGTYKGFYWLGQYPWADRMGTGVQGGGVYRGDHTLPLTGIRFAGYNQNLTSGDFTLYGLGS